MPAGRRADQEMRMLRAADRSRGMKEDETMNWSMDSKMLRKNARQIRRDLGKRLSAFPGYDLDDALEVVGLRRTPKPAARFFSGLGLVMGGVAAGVVLGMIFLPRRKEMRQKLTHATQSAVSGVKGAMHQAREYGSGESSQHRSQ